MENGSVYGSKLFLHTMMINTLISDPAVALELGRRLAVNAKRQPRLRRRWSAALNRLFAERGSEAKTSCQSRA